MAQTVMIFGRMRCTAPSIDRLVQVGSSSSCARRAEFVPRVIEVEQHHDAGLGIEAGERDEADPHGDAHVVAEQVEQPERADQRERHRQQHDERLRDAICVFR